MARLFLATLIAASVASLAQASLDLPKEKETWTSISADEFAIFSNASDRDTIKLATDLLRMREALGKVTRLNVRSMRPTNVFIFRNAESFAPYRDAIFEKAGPNVTGVFFNTPSRDFIILRADAPGGIDRTIYHELTHNFVENNLPGLPLWFNEGIAEYYSTFSIKGGDVNIGMPIPEHVIWLRNENPIPLAKLFAIDSHSDEYHEGRRQGVFYAESWALVHYLMRDDESRKKLAQYLALVKAKRPSDEAFRVAFETTLDAMERELRSYIRRFSYEYNRYSLSQIQTTPIPDPQPMQRADLLYELGDLLSRSKRSNFEVAEPFLRAAIAINENHAGAWADLALIHDESGKKQEAGVEYEKAVALGARDADVYLMYGDSLLRKIAGKVTTEDSSKARSLFSKAAEIDPTSAMAFAGIGATFVVSDEDPSPGIVALEKSLALAPGQAEVALNLVELYVRAGRLQDAERLTNQTIAPSGKKEVLQAAQSILADADQRKQSAKQVDAINDAVRLANTGEIAAALRAIDEILPTITDPALAESARKFRDQLTKAKSRK